MSLPVAVLAGGLATRLQSVTASIPKSLVEVAGQPFAVHQIALLRSHGLTDIVFLVGHLGNLIQELLGDGSRWRVDLRYVFDGAVRLGTGGAIPGAVHVLGDAFFVLYGDSYLECDYQAIERSFLGAGTSGMMTVHRNDNQWDRSNVRFDEGRIIEYDKQHPTDDMRHIDYGLGVFRARHSPAMPAGKSSTSFASIRICLAGTISRATTRRSGSTRSDRPPVSRPPAHISLRETSP